MKTPVRNILLALALGIIFCNPLGLGISLAATKPLRVGLVLDKGGKDDKSFNASAYRGATEAKNKLGIQLKVVESSDDSSYEPALRTFARNGFDLVIAIGFAMQEAV